MLRHALNRSAVAVLGMVLVASTGTSSAMATSSQDAGWEVMELPLELDNSDAASILTLAEDDVWAFGCEDINGIVGSNCFAVHWDGADWSLSEDFPEQLWGMNVSASSPSDIWVGGIAERESGNGDPRKAGIAHFDGESWSFEDLDEHTNLVYDIEVHEPGDVWWVGGCCGYPVLLARSGDDGWQTQELEDEYNSGALDVLTPEDVWATVPVFTEGRMTDIGVLRGNQQDGMDNVANLTESDFDNAVDIVARAEDDVWVHGYTSEEEDGPAIPLIQHWDGTEWNATETPFDQGTAQALIEHGDQLWAVGGGTQSWLLRWDDEAASWQQDLPSLEGYGVQAADTAPDGSAIWSVGVRDGQMVAARYVPE